MSNMRMTQFPFLSLKGITIDEAIARRLPRHLAYYHRILPIAQDGEAITVVMAYPNNLAVVGLLETVLNGSIIPVRGDEREIQAALDRIFPASDANDQLRILNYGNEQFAAYFASLLSAELTTIDVERGSAMNIVAAANTGRYDLTIMNMPEIAQVGDLLRSLSSALLLPSPTIGVTSQPYTGLRNTLCILRGHAPDEIMLDWAIRLAKNSGTRLSLLAVAGSEGFRTRGISGLLTAQHATGEHIAGCVKVITEAGIEGTLKLRQGEPFQQIVHEVRIGNYDLLVVAAEAYGDFVQRMLSQLSKANGSDSQDEQSNIPSVLVVRPV